VDEQLDVDTARARILAAFQPLPPVRTPLLDALGMVLTEEIRADAPLPPFSNSAMDGYALRSHDVQPASADKSVVLRIIGEIPAGQEADNRVEPGTALRIMTGAPVPEGADAVVRFEDTDEAGQPAEERLVAIHHPARRGENIRPAGEDLAAGDLAVSAGTALRPAEIGLLAALGRESVDVHRRPTVAVLATGDEIVDASEPLGPAQIRNSNSPMIAALIERTGGQPVLLGVARDSTRALSAKLADAATCDLIITTGGVSAGDYDFVKTVLQVEGAIDLWQLRIRPGKPLAFGSINNRPLIGLPGNPVAAAVAFEQFARPAIRTMLGHREIGIPTVQAELQDRVENPGGRRAFLRVQIESSQDGRYLARLAGSQGSGVLSSMVRANGLLVVPEDLPIAHPGAILPVQMIDWQID
jgi:molybdopterin molybdotransferase